jgi:hypothetical protein
MHSTPGQVFVAAYQSEDGAYSSRGVRRNSETSSPERVSGKTTYAAEGPPTKPGISASATKPPGRCEPSGCSTHTF